MHALRANRNKAKQSQFQTGRVRRDCPLLGAAGGPFGWISLEEPGYMADKSL